MGAEALLEVDGLGVYYGSVQGLDSVSVTVADSGAVSILGPNGAGKTTLLRAISGLLAFHGGRVVSGCVRFRGEDISGADPAALVRRGIVQVLEGRRMFPELSVEDNLRAGAFAVRDRRRAQEARAMVLDLFPNLALRLAQPAGLLSGGEQQMVAIGRALMSQPTLLMLDEPSLGLAPLIVRSIGEALRQINESGVGLLLVEQSSALASTVTREAYLLETGHVRASGSTEKLVADEQVRAVYLGVQQ
jgi:ABC-type branched-subunit amino acid transport system ATPase component